MASNRLLLIGAGGHAKSCIDVIESVARYDIIGCVGRNEEMGAHLLGYRVLGDDAMLPTLLRDSDAALVAIGQIRTALRRIALFQLVCEFGVPATIVSPYARVSPRAEIGIGTIVMAGAVINAGAQIGRNCIINTGALVEHDAEVQDHCHISTHAVVNGATRVLMRSFVGSGAILREGIVIGADSIISMGERVLRDQEPGTYLKNGR